MEELKETILNTVAQLQDGGVDLEQTPALFKWSYPEEPFIQYQLLIREFPDPVIDEHEALH